MFYKIYKNKTNLKDKKMLGKSKNKSNFDILEESPIKDSSKNCKKNYKEKYNKHEKFIKNFNDSSIRTIKDKKKYNITNEPDIKIIKNNNDEDITYEVNYDKNINNITNFKKDIKNVLKINNIESIFNDPFFRN